MSKNKFFKKLLVAGLCALTATATIGTAATFAGCKKDDPQKQSQTEEYTVTFKLDYDGAPADTKQKVEKGGKATKPADPTRTGYTFGGWILVGAESEYNFDTAVNNDITLKAKWTKIDTPDPDDPNPPSTKTEYTITWDLDGGEWETGYTPTTKVEKGTEITLPGKAEKSGHVLEGWSISGSPALEEGATVKVTANVTFKAVWKANGTITPPPADTYTVTYDMNGHGTALPPEENVASIGANTLEVPSATGWVFGGWYLEAACTTPAIGKTLTANITVYAKWTEVVNYASISARDNVVSAVTSDFSTETEGTKLPLFSGTYGKEGFYSLPANGGDYSANYVQITNGAAKHVAAGNNVAMIVDFGPVKNVVEGYLELTCSDMGSSWDIVSFYAGTSKVFTIKNNSSKVLAYTLNGTEGASATSLTPTANQLYRIHYKFDLTTGKVTAEIAVGTNDFQPIVTDLDANIKELSGIQLTASNSGKRLLTIDNVAVSADRMTVAEYKTYVIGKLEKKADNAAYTGDQKIALDAACNAAKTAVEAATDINGVCDAYTAGVTAMNEVKNDLQAAQAAAITELNGYKSQSDYSTENWALVQAEVEKGVAAVNAATTVADVQTALTNAKTAIDQIPDNNAATWTITFNDGSADCGTLLVVQGQSATLAALKAKVNVPSGKKISAIYTDSAKTNAVTEDYTPAADVTLYVAFAEIQSTTKTLTPDGLSGTLNDKTSTGLVAVGSNGFYVTNGGSDIKISTQNSKTVIQTGGGVAVDTTANNPIKNGIAIQCNAGNITVSVKYFQGSADRYVLVLDENGNSLGNTSSNPTTADKAVKEGTMTFTLSTTGYIYIGSASSGLYFTEISVTYEV